MENQNPTPVPTPSVLETPENISPPPNMDIPKPKFPLVAIIGIIIFLLVAGSAAGFYVFKPQIMKLVSKPTPTPTIVRTSPTPTPDPTANWQIYENETHKYSIGIPDEWRIDQESEQNNQFNRVWIFSNDYDSKSNTLGPPMVTNGLSLQIFNGVPGNGNGPAITGYSELKNVTIDGQKGAVWLTNSFPNQIGYYVEFPSKQLDENIIISISSSQRNDELIDQILSTFTFDKLSASKFTN